MNHYTAKQIAEILQKEDSQMNLRTVRYYTQIGVIPSLELVGNKRVYTDNHLHYFRAILTLSKCGETLSGIQEKLHELTMDEIIKIGEKLPLYQTEQMMNHETHRISEDVFISFNSQTSPELKSKIIETVSQLVKGRDI
ncbi:DNA-binding transcriptional MerR regulator [Paenibacillus castaneae]|uniref:MerR family transcriptional regulator n=1 Tax=Paenibacillus castaneae TaxID=474957 RepID=UPI000C9C80B9|nr:MerR family transcriptional regulator [Paenibacillus castaneae]NIK76815.1 DNA-binding transcriptional MerR regulator [Paenibacillus castaneae]